MEKEDSLVDEENYHEKCRDVEKMFIPPEEVQVPVNIDRKRSQSIISLQVKTRNKELEILSEKKVALHYVKMCENLGPKIMGVIGQNRKQFICKI